MTILKFQNRRYGTHWVRVEMQLRRDRALEFSRLPGTIGERFAGVLVNYLRYVEPCSDSHKHRWPLTDYWATLVGSAAAISIYTKPGLEYNVLRCENYVYRQAGNAIDALIKCYGQDRFFDKLQKRSARPNPKYSHMVEDFLRGCSEEIQPHDKVQPVEAVAEPTEEEMQREYLEVIDGFNPDAKTKTVDKYGRRWIRCDTCGAIKESADFVYYGGSNGQNRGICSECSRR
mgnify:CR=1 FL=1